MRLMPSATILFGNSVGGLTDYLFSGVLHRFAHLKLMFAECQTLIPYLLSGRRRLGYPSLERRTHCPNSFSTYYYQITSCFFKDPVAPGSR
jgi:hypothetical protein